MAITRIKADTALSGTIPATNISSASLANVSTGTSWQSVVVADGSTGITAVAGEGYFIDTTSGAITVTLPGIATVGDTIVLKDYNGTWATNNVTISSTLKISGADADGTLSTNNTTVTIVYMDTTKGWTPIQNSTQSALAADTTYISATGGTVTESGDYKIHTFTGDGCFVVSALGSGTPLAPNTVDYLVIAGGGGGGTNHGGGGGAGGWRASDGTNSGCYTAGPAPLTGCVAGVTLSLTTYPISVGAGGGGSNPGNLGPGTLGSNSIFSTITSSGGGGGSGNEVGATGPFNSGGSGGGGKGEGTPNVAGTGNTPPTSPPQGNPGGTGAGPGGGLVSGGGGGAGGAGTNASGPGGPGGNGVASSITGTPITKAGGGAGGGRTPNPGGSGGSGGGGPGGGAPGPADSGTPAPANTGSGGGGSGGEGTPIGGGNGGSGYVAIRYKFQ